MPRGARFASPTRQWAVGQHVGRVSPAFASSAPAHALPVHVMAPGPNVDVLDLLLCGVGRVEDILREVSAYCVPNQAGLLGQGVAFNIDISGNEDVRQVHAAPVRVPGLQNLTKSE